MTLLSYTSDKLFSNKIGVQTSPSDNTPNPYMRDQLLSAIKTLLKQETHHGKIQIYTHCYNVCFDYDKKLETIKKELDIELAEKKVLFEESKINVRDYDYKYYENQILAYENVINLIKMQLEKGAK